MLCKIIFFKEAHLPTYLPIYCTYLSLAPPHKSHCLLHLATHPSSPSLLHLFAAYSLTHVACPGPAWTTWHSSPACHAWAAWISSCPVCLTQLSSPTLPSLPSLG